MTLPARYTLDRVPWGDCACCDSGRCAAHVEHPDRDPPSRPTTAALVEKIERLYVRTLEEKVRELTTERDAAFRRGVNAAADEMDRLLTKRKATAIWVGPDELRDLADPKDTP